MKKIILFSFSLVLGVFAQNNTLESYVKLGLKNNLTLKQKRISLQQSIAALDEARGMFFPSLSINARYTRAGGGREIIFPVGDLFNPIYRTLNALTRSTQFPTNLSNQVIPFLREKEHDTKVSLILPIIQPALFYNYGIKSDLTEIKKIEKNIYKRKLIADIKIAYYNYLKSIKINKLFLSTIELVKENLRVSESLYKNDKVTIDVVYRAKAELSEIEQKQLEAKRNAELAKSYFNFLLNKPLESEIEIFEDNNSIKNIPQNDFEKRALLNREELSQIKLAVDVAKGTAGLAKSKYLPGLALAVDYGFQGEKYKFTEDDDYWMASIVLSWNLFNGFQDKAKAEQAELEAKKIFTQLTEVKNQIRLQVKEAVKNYLVAEKTINATNERLESFRKSYKIIKRKYAEGMASQIEYLDARNKLTQAEVQAIIAQYDYKQKYAQLEQIVALVDLSKYEN
jgi:outer membrane protein TolC